MNEELKPCKCGNPVEVKYIAGVSTSLQKYISNPFVDSVPTYYILCDKCGCNDFERVNRANYTYQQKCKRNLIRRWNKRVK